MHLGITPLHPLLPTHSFQASFLGNSPLYWFFMKTPLKVRFFSKSPQNKILSSLTPSYILTVTKSLVKIFQFEFLVMTEKNIFAYIINLFLSLSITDFSLFFA